MRILGYDDERAVGGLRLNGIWRCWVNDPAPRGRRVASMGAVIGVPALYRARIVTWSSLGFKYPGGLGAEPPCWRDRDGG